MLKRTVGSLKGTECFLNLKILIIGLEALVVNKSTTSKVGDKYRNCIF